MHGERARSLARHAEEPTMIARIEPQPQRQEALRVLVLAYPERLRNGRWPG
jgi:hypothetical protein